MVMFHLISQNMSYTHRKRMSILILIILIYGVPVLVAAQSNVYKQALKHIEKDLGSKNIYISPKVHEEYCIEDYYYLIDKSDSLNWKQSMQNYDKDTVKYFKLPIHSKKKKSYNSIAYFFKYSCNILMVSVYTGFSDDQLKIIDFSTIDELFLACTFWGLNYYYLFYFDKGKIQKCYKFLMNS